MRLASAVLLLLPLPAWLCGCSSEPDVPAAGGITAEPLPPRGPMAATRFVRRANDETGLVFANLLRRENLLPYIYSGAGVAVGDYDDDGLPDVYLVSQDGPNKLFRQTAPWRFEDVTANAGTGLDGGEVWGASASFADVDGDGDLDLYVCNTEAPNQLFQNGGDGTFQEVAGRFGLATVASSVAAAFADYDNDGDLDLYLLTNRVFGPRLPQALVDETTPPAGTRTTKAEMFPPFPELVREGDEVSIPPGFEGFYDLYEGRLFVAGQPDRLFRNDGYAQWTDVTERAGIDDHGQGLSVTWWDCDGDGLLDIYVANDLESPDQLYRNRGDGTFENITKKALPHTAYFGMGSDFGDIDNDGRFDLCVADMSSTSHYMGKMLMGSMSDKRWFLMNAEPRQHMRNALFVNSGTDRFLEAAQLAGLASSDWTWAVRFADLDEDGRLDFFATNGIPRFDDNPDAAAEFTRLWRSGARTAAVDVYRALEPVAERNIAKRNLGDLEFEDVSAAWGLDEQTVGQGTALADLDRDGDLDIVINNLNEPISVFENTSSDTRRITVRLIGTRDNHAGVGSRIAVTAGGSTQTRLVSTMRGYKGSEEPLEYFGFGPDVTTIEELSVRWPDGSEQRFADLGVDRAFTIRQASAPDAAASRAAPPPVPTAWLAPTDALVEARRHAERDFDDFAVQPLLPHRLSRLGPGVALGDVDGDGLDECFLGGAAGQAGALQKRGADGAWVEVPGPWEADSECEDMGAVFVDFDTDGDLDLFVVSGSIEAEAGSPLLRDRLYENLGDGRGFARAADDTLPDLRRSGSSVAAADFDRDGDVDLFVGTRTAPGRYPESEASALLRNEDGRFVDVTAILAPDLLEAGMVTGAVFSDLDGDDWADLVVCAHGRPILVLTNPDQGEAFRDDTVASALGDLRGLWNGIAAADLDNDGDTDLVVTNLGLNTQYHADRAHPLRIFASDFDEDGQLDVVEAKYEGDQLLPVRGLSCSSEAMPFVRKRFPTFDAFARASLPEIYGADRLRDSTELVVDELRHVVLENRAGAFAVHPLPRRAQIAPSFGIGIADLDADGMLDLAIAQNFDSPEPETGRMAGGLGAVLRNVGGMQFEHVSATTSGLWVPEDAKGVAIADLNRDGSPDLVVTTNDGPVRAFVGQPTVGAAGLRVRLRGPAGNPAAIGTRVQLRPVSGPMHTREVTAGSGYLSQSSPTLYFAGAQKGDDLAIRWWDGTLRVIGITTEAQEMIEVDY